MKDEIQINISGRAKPLLVAGWIPVSQQLPKDFSFVLATIQTEHDTWVEVVGFLWQFWDLPGRGTTDNVIAWMPIPEPYNP